MAVRGGWLMGREKSGQGVIMGLEGIVAMAPDALLPVVLPMVAPQ